MKPLSVLRLLHTTMVLWPDVPGAECVALTRTGSAPVSLSGTEQSYTWVDSEVVDADLTDVVVEPRSYTVSVFGGGALLERFAHVVDCAPLVFVAARGSGQNGLFDDAFARGLGNRAERVIDRLRQELGRDERSLPAIAVEYPALAVGLGQDAVGNVPDAYASSASLGSSNAQIVVLRTLRSCPSTRIVMFGYSQGAQVIGDAFAALPPIARRRVVRVILFADATWRGDDPRVLYRPAALPPDGSGIKGARPLFPVGDGAVIESWCWEADAICQRPPRGRRFHGPVYDDYEVLAAQAAAVALRP